MTNIKDRTEEAIKHWSAWARDNGNWRQTCCSFERFFVLDKSRYGFPDDIEKQYRFKYDQRIAEKVESIICKYLVGTEKLVIIACEVYGAGMTYNEIARRLHIPLRSLMRFRENAFIKIGRNYG